MYGPADDDLSVLYPREPEYPECDTTDVVKNGAYERHPYGCLPVQMQRYFCSSCGSFSPSHPSVEDNHRHPRTGLNMSRSVLTSRVVRRGRAGIARLSSYSTRVHGMARSTHRVSVPEPGSVRRISSVSGPISSVKGPYSYQGHLSHTEISLERTPLRACPKNVYLPVNQAS